MTAASIDYDGPLPTAEPVASTDLTGISIEVSRTAAHFEGGWVLLDALTLPLMYAEPSRIYRFTSTLMGNLAARNVRGVYCPCPDAVEDATVEQFRSLFDAEPTWTCEVVRTWFVTFDRDQVVFAVSRDTPDLFVADIRPGRSMCSEATPPQRPSARSTPGPRCAF